MLSVNVKIISFLFCISWLLTGWVYGGTVVGSSHDFSSSTQTQVCVYCHTPHHAADPTIAPLWNRSIQNLSAFTVYGSSTMDTTPSNPPSNISLACLSCHDLVQSQALPQGAAYDSHRLLNFPGSGGLNSRGPTGYSGTCIKCHTGSHGSYMPAIYQTGPNLTNDHPISMPYPTAVQDAAFNSPPDDQKGWSDVRLYRGKVECTSCHNPHNNDITPFLRKANTNSALCFTCHDK